MKPSLPTLIERAMESFDEKFSDNVAKDFGGNKVYCVFHRRNEIKSFIVHQLSLAWNGAFTTAKGVTGELLEEGNDI